MSPTAGMHLKINHESGYLEAIKLDGDSYVPRGEITWKIAQNRRCHEMPLHCARFLSPIVSSSTR